jgi:hypothetical protein
MVVVPNIITALLDYHYTVTPVFYWATREGGNMSRDCFADTPVKLLALYARRPKVNCPGMNKIFVKLNELLFARAEVFHSNGIFAFAGVPLADSLDRLLLSTACVYFNLQREWNEDLIEIEIDQEGRASAPLPYQLIIGAIADRIANLLFIDWRKALKLIDETRRSDYKGFYQYGDLYKPVYLIVR